MIPQILVEEIIRRFPDYIDAEAARGISGVVGWELIGPGNEVDRFSLVVEDGVVKVGRDLDVEPTVTLRLGVVGFLKIATGNGDPSTMVLAGDLELTGDSWLALDLLRLIRIPAPDGMAHLSGPNKVDVGAVARLVREIPDRQLRERLRGPVRNILLEEIFRRMPSYLDAQRAAHVNALVAWQITGRRDGGFDEYRTLISDGRCTVGELAGRPRVSVRTDPVVFLKLVTGSAGALPSLLRRRLSISGDVLFAGRLPRLFRIPTG